MRKQIISGIAKTIVGVGKMYKDIKEEVNKEWKVGVSPKKRKARTGKAQKSIIEKGKV